MEEAPSWLPSPFVGVVALAGTMLLASLWYERRRSQALADAAARLGLAFQRKPDDTGGAPFRSLPLFQLGRSRGLRNVARSEDLWIFGYTYDTGRGDNRSQHRQTVAAVKVRGGRLPAFQLEHEGVFQRLAASFGGQDVDFDGDPEFSKRFRLRGDDEAALRELFEPGLRQYLLTKERWSVEGQGEWLIVYRPGHRMRPDDLAGFVQEVRSLAAHFD